MTQPRFGRFAIVALALGLGVALLVAAVWYLPSSSVQPGRSVPWKLGNMSGRFDPSAATTTTDIPIEASHPGCTPSSGGSWFDTLVTYTPVSVTIQIRMTAAAAAKCANVGPLGGGEYLSGEQISVHLREPLGGRALFDGFMFPAVARPYR
jgi:hypothetical protein